MDKLKTGKSLVDIIAPLVGVTVLFGVLKNIESSTLVCFLYLVGGYESLHFLNTEPKCLEETERGGYKLGLGSPPAWNPVLALVLCCVTGRFLGWA